MVAALIIDDAGRVLVNQRTREQTHAGEWEFPGGKVEVGETEEQALRRELREELGVEVTTSTFGLRVTHEYAERQVQLSVWRVSEYTGTPSGIEGQPLRWLKPAELRELPLLEADRPIVTWLESTTLRT